MEREEFIGLIRSIIWHEGYQSKRERVIKSSVKEQRRNINIIADALSLKKLSYDETEELGYG